MKYFWKDQQSKYRKVVSSLSSSTSFPTKLTKKKKYIKLQITWNDQIFGVTYKNQQANHKVYDVSTERGASVKISS